MSDPDQVGAYCYDLARRSVGPTVGAWMDESRRRLVDAGLGDEAARATVWGMMHEAVAEVPDD